MSGIICCEGGRLVGDEGNQIWFVMTEHLLSPLLAAKNEAWNGVLQYDSPAYCDSVNMM